jgi:hypothetical protein
MQEVTCSKCGASAVLSAKFCRQCGNPLDGSELTTQSLDASQPRFDNPTRPANSGVTAPTYMQVNVPPHTAAPIYGAPPSSGTNKTALFLIIGAIVTVLLGLGIIAGVVLFRSAHPPTELPPPPLAGPRHGGPPPPPPPPGGPQPPPPAESSAGFPFNASLRYPGARLISSSTDTDSSNAELTTSDPINKVAEWFRKRMNVTDEDSDEGMVTLTSDEVEVTLEEDNGGTRITMSHDID